MCWCALCVSWIDHVLEEVLRPVQESDEDLLGMLLAVLWNGRVPNLDLGRASIYRSVVL